jgi:hypothetical protein
MIVFSSTQITDFALFRLEYLWTGRLRRQNTHTWHQIRLQQTLVALFLIITPLNSAAFASAEFGFSGCGPIAEYARPIHAPPKWTDVNLHGPTWPIDLYPQNDKSDHGNAISS